MKIEAFFRRHYPLLFTLGILSLVTMALTISMVQRLGRFVYALDDPYIHMSIAKNFIHHGIWGVTKYGFASLSSSLIWPLLLSLVYFLFGVNELIPFILNYIFAVLICFLSYRFFKNFNLRPLLIFIGLMSILLFTPLFMLIFCGMEHTLFVLISIVFVYFSSKNLSKEQVPLPGARLLLLLSPVLTMCRYEGVFLVFIVSCLFAVKRKFLYALLLGGLGLLPIGIYGLLSVAKGWYFLPNSVLLKNYLCGAFSYKDVARLFFPLIAINRIYRIPHIFILFVFALVFLILRFKNTKSLWDEKNLMAVIFLAATLLHMQFVRTLLMAFRYEAYLVGLGVFVTVIFLNEYLPMVSDIAIGGKIAIRHIAFAGLCSLLALPFAEYGIKNLAEISQATKNIYEQQYQMGLFLSKFYQGKSVAVNDIGAVSYLADIDILDLWGLSSMEVAVARRRGAYNAEFMYALAKTRDIKIAIVYREWFDDGFGGMPSQWKMVRQWKIADKLVCGGDTVSFYAVDPDETGGLIKNLNIFSTYLPKGVVQNSGPFLDKSL